MLTVAQPSQTLIASSRVRSLSAWAVADTGNVTDPWMGTMLLVAGPANVAYEHGFLVGRWRGHISRPPSWAAVPRRTHIWPLPARDTLAVGVSFQVPKHIRLTPSHRLHTSVR